MIPWASKWKICSGECVTTRGGNRTLRRRQISPRTLLASRGSAPQRDAVDQAVACSAELAGGARALQPRSFGEPYVTSGQSEHAQGDGRHRKHAQHADTQGTCQAREPGCRIGSEREPTAVGEQQERTGS